MVVQHNLTAMNSNRMLNVNTKSQAKSTEKLSSGFKINRAADDAAGLSISEKMRKQIRGLSQASSNAQDGISAVQTAEGALNEVQDMLQRMNELAVKAANGTNSKDDRNYIQNEIDQLVSEVDRVAATTKFNETYLLQGTTPNAEYRASFKAVTESAMTVTDTTAKGTQTTDDVLTFDGTKWYNQAGTEVTLSADNAVYGAKVAGGNVGDKLIYSGATGRLTKQEADLTHGAPLFDENGNRIAENALGNYFDINQSDGTVTMKANAKVFMTEGGKNQLLSTNTTAIAKYVGSTKDQTSALSLKLHVGADATSNNQIKIDITAMSAAGLGLKNDPAGKNLQVAGEDDKEALYSIEVIKEAIQKISTQRSSLGAAQNRLEHTINNLDNVVENTTSAESSIRDTNMASEMVKYSNNNILAQAGQAMLAQANQTNQGVLALLG